MGNKHFMTHAGRLIVAELFVPYRTVPYQRDGERVRKGLVYLTSG